MKAEPPAPDASSKAWNSRSLGSPLQYGIFYLLIRIGGRFLSYGLLRIVVLYYTLFRPSIANRSNYYLSRRFPESGSLRRLVNRYRLMYELGKTLVDTAILGLLGPDRMKVHLLGGQELAALLAEGHGLVVVTSHAGCWQVTMPALRFLEHPVNLLIHREKGDIDPHYFDHMGENSPFHIIDPAGYLGGTLEMMAALKRGEVLCIMGDRPMGSLAGTLAVDFLGGRIRLPISPYKLAAANQAPLVVVYPSKVGPDAYSLELVKILRMPELTGRSCELYRPFAEQYAETLEAFVRDHPFQFFNFFDMWRSEDRD